MNIKIIGDNSSNRIKLLKNLNKATKDMSNKIEINILDDEKTLEMYKSINKPIFIINEKIISNGKILTDKEIKRYIKLFA